MFERPKKSDLDRTLSQLMHDSRHKLLEELNRLKTEAVKVGALQSNRALVSAVKAADDVHKLAMEQAQLILLYFIERVQCAPSEVINWARPHLETLGDSVLALVLPNNFPQDRQRLTNQYQTVFQQRLDGMLRDAEIGFLKGAGFSRVEEMESKEEWISADDAIQLLKPSLGTYEAQMTICKRAHAGMIRSRAQRLIVGGKTSTEIEIERNFWWAEGRSSLNQNWAVGDFDTWVNRDELHLEAFGVTFLKSHIEELIPLGKTPLPQSALAAGRKGASDLELLICRFHLVAQQLRSRHGSRTIFEIVDEYDAQDLLHAMLMIFFDDVRKEEWTPSYAGGASRMDFLLPELKTAIEVKKSRPTLGARQLGEELIVDIEKYRNHSQCERLVCFVYDPESYISNPRGLENDLSKQRDELIVRVMIEPRLHR